MQNLDKCPKITSFRGDEWGPQRPDSAKTLGWSAESLTTSCIRVIVSKVKRIRKCTHPEEVLAGLQSVHEVLRVDVDHRVEQVEPLSQVLLHGVQVLVRPGEAAQLPLLHELEAGRVCLSLGEAGQLGHPPGLTAPPLTLGALAFVQLLLQLLFEAFLERLELLRLRGHEAGAAAGGVAAPLEAGGAGAALLARPLLQVTARHCL